MSLIFQDFAHFPQKPKFKKMLSSRVISKTDLRHLSDYKYTTVDHSILARVVLRSYWNWAVTLFPCWMAPNLISLFGLMFIMLNFLLVVVFIPDLKTPTSSWVYFAYVFLASLARPLFILCLLRFALNTWLYSTFDNVDGKQARRTQSSSPLGELFDHGCDALSTCVRLA